MTGWEGNTRPIRDSNMVGPEATTPPLKGADESQSDVFKLLEKEIEINTSRQEGCSSRCSCTVKSIPGKVMVEHDVTSHETPCVCSRLLDTGDNLAGWESQSAENCNCKQTNANKNKKPLPYSKLYQKDQPDDFVFKHYRDSRMYIEQYRLYHTKGTIKPEADNTPVLGHDAPDPYLPKLRSIRARLHSDAFMDSRSKTFSGFDKRSAFQPFYTEDKRRQATLNNSSQSQPHVATHESRSGGSHSASSGEGDSNPRPHTTSRCTEEINLAPTREKLSGEKKQHAEAQPYMDLQTPRATFPLPVRIVEDYCGVSGNKARATSPKAFKPHHPHPSTSSLSPRTSHSNSHLQETIALMQKFPENQSNVSNMILSAISDPTVYQHYLAKLKKVEHGQPGALLMGSTVSKTEKPKRGAQVQKEKNVQLGLCELYSSGSGLYTGTIAHAQHQNINEKERPKDVPQGPLSKLDVRGCQYRGSATRKTLTGRTRRALPSGGRRSGCNENE